MGAAGSSEKPTEEKKEPLADAKAAEEMAVRQPNEASPLVGGVSDETLTSAKEKMQAGISLASLVIIAVVKVQVTARLFESAHYPTAYSMWSCVITCICLVPLFIARPSLWAVPTWEMKDVLTLIVVFTAADLGFTNIALANIPTAVQQSIASTNPFWTILLETFLYRKYAHIVTYVTVVLIIIGAILAAQAPSHRDGNATLGLASACIAVLCSASKAVFTHSAFKKFKSQMGAMPLLFWVDIFMLPFYIVATLILQSEGRPELVTFFGTRTHSRIHAHNTQTHHQHHLRAHTHNALSLSFLARAVECFQSAGLFWAMTFTAALGGARALAGFFVLSFVTATSTSTANILAQILNILVSIPLQHLVMPASMVVGVTTVIASVAFYAFIKAYKPFLPEVDAKLEANGLQVLMLTKLDVPSVPGAAALPGAEAKPAPS